MTAPAPPSPSSLDRIALMHLVYPQARSYPARLRRFVEATRKSVPTAQRPGAWTG
jgi:hypothetical protein